MEPTRTPVHPSPSLDPGIEVPPPAPWRRSLLVFTGLSLLAAGVVLNAERLGLTPAHEIETTQNAAVAVDPHAAAPEHEAGGSGQRHHGE